MAGLLLYDAWCGSDASRKLAQACGALIEFIETKRLIESEDSQRLNDPQGVERPVEP